jgi:hypothetical protein
VPAFVHASTDASIPGAHHRLLEALAVFARLAGYAPSKARGHASARALGLGRDR